ncbi:glucose/arabinose dehydrogenase [Crossiella equi]|uniref:Glucose/arabinose dehydrogenase n=1 Tax=Crossiella equi TaxID=130796 RepID=A0ABS5A651_9PSEU|nr:PQQ-dependent sugar dehydrogenase [Crossiella equi]MBP2472031.1 glucose/arabinose dehydrogenase [Crossiella equi]
MRYEAENAFISQGVVESNHAGFSGTGFVNNDNVAGSYVEWTVNAPSAVANASLAFRFANGSGANRPVDISVNGNLVGNDQAFPNTGWTNYQSVTITAPLQAGENKIRATGATAAGGPNLDALDVDTAPAPPRGNPQPPTTVSTGWSIPWAVSFLPDGQSALVTERDTFRVFRAGLNGSKTQVGTVPNSTTTGGEGGLMGVAVSPTWNGTSDQDVFFFHTSNDGGAQANRIVKMSFNGTALSNRQVIVNNLPASRFHNGGQLKFGPDGFLYATTGDAQNTSLAQNLGSPAGKILRFTKTGAAAPGNPFNSLVYSYGHRNAQGLAWDSAGRLWSSELGNVSRDELNLILPGRNYGWPTCEGDCNVGGMENPKRTWSTAENSPSSLAIVNDTAYIAALRGQRLWRVELNGTSAGATTSVFNTFGRLRSVVKVPGASALWIGTTNADGNGGQGPGSDRILRSEIR